MSIKLMSAAWDLDIPSTEKMVLLCLCDFANDDGVCWPSIASIMRKTSKSERTVQAAMKWLKDNGYFAINGWHEKTPKYTLDPRKICTPADFAPPQNLRNTPAKSAPKPSRTTIVNKADALLTKRAPVEMPEGVELAIWNDFLELRKAKRAPLSNTALAAIDREASKAGWSLNDALAECTARGWQGFKADWVNRNGTANRTGSQNGRPADGFTAVLRDVGSREDAFATAGDDGRLRPAAQLGPVAPT